MNSMEPLVSVVTPVYNTDKYLSECIESVLSQSYKNFEYIIVNNCSTDKSLDIARSYAKKDSRIRIFNNTEFLDLIPNWNNSLNKISKTSKYCKVVHADDWLFKDCLTQMVALAEANPKVGLVGSYRLDENQVNLDGLPHTDSIIQGADICRRYFLNNLYVFGSPTSLLIRSDCIKQNFYNESNIHADLESCFMMLQSSDFGFVHQVLTYTRRHNESNTSFIRRYNTHKIGELIVLTKFGRFYLNENEYDIVFKKFLKLYYRALAKTLLVFRTKDAISYNKKQLLKANIKFKNSRLLSSLLTIIFNRALRLIAIS